MVIRSGEVIDEAPLSQPGDRGLHQAAVGQGNAGHLGKTLHPSQRVTRAAA